MWIYLTYDSSFSCHWMWERSDSPFINCSWEAALRVLKILHILLSVESITSVQNLLSITNTMNESTDITSDFARSKRLSLLNSKQIRLRPWRDLDKSENGCLLRPPEYNCKRFTTFSVCMDWLLCVLPRCDGLWRSHRIRIVRDPCQITPGSHRIRNRNHNRCHSDLVCPQSRSDGYSIPGNVEECNKGQWHRRSSQYF